MTDEIEHREQTSKDRSYTPSSDRETEQKQDRAPDIGHEDDEAVLVLPGTGGPDDAGDVDVDDTGIRERLAARGVDPSDRPVG